MKRKYEKPRMSHRFSFSNFSILLFFKIHVYEFVIFMHALGWYLCFVLVLVHPLSSRTLGGYVFSRAAYWGNQPVPIFSRVTRRWPNKILKFKIIIFYLRFEFCVFQLYYVCFSFYCEVFSFLWASFWVLNFEFKFP